MKIKHWISFIGALGFLLVSINANALPRFATKTGKNCSYCHTSFPQLNSKGRAYKEAGYRLPAEVGKDTANFLEEGEFPFSTLLVARPFDKKGSGEKKIRAIHEVEIIGTVTLGKHLSGMFAIEGEDEADFNAEVAEAIVTYTVNPQLNIQVSYSDMFFADPYGLLSEHFKITRGSPKIIDQEFGGSDGALSSARQNITVFGRVANRRVFYMVGYSGNAGNTEGVDARNFLGRVAVDITPNIMVGGFWIEGENAATNRQYRRVGIDFLADIKNLRIGGSFIQGKDDSSDLLGRVTNDAFSVQASYFFKTASGAPIFVPTVRLDQYQMNGGQDQYTEAVVNLTYYPEQYVKVYVEYWNQLDTPVGQPGDTRLTLQAVFAF